MSSRVTFRHLAVAEKALLHFASKQTTQGTTGGEAPQIRLVEACLRICREELNHGFEAEEQVEGEICGVLRKAADARADGKPLWAGYAEAALHFAERTLGMYSSRLKGRESALINPERTRGLNCGTYSTPAFIGDTMVKELLEHLERSSLSSLDIVDLSLDSPDPGLHSTYPLLRDRPRPGSPCHGYAALPIWSLVFRSWKAPVERRQPR
jgi:hypothetical protein